MPEMYPKPGKKQKAPGYKSYKEGKLVEEHTTEFYKQQLAFAQDESAEAVDQYALPGTDAKKRASDNYEYTYPISRYRSIRP